MGAAGASPSCHGDTVHIEEITTALRSMRCLERGQSIIEKKNNSNKGEER